MISGCSSRTRSSDTWGEGKDGGEAIEGSGGEGASTLNPQPSALKPYTLNPHPSTLDLNPSTFNPQPQPSTSALNPQPLNLQPQPSTLNPQPRPSTSTLHLQPQPPYFSTLQPSPSTSTRSLNLNLTLDLPSTSGHRTGLGVRTYVHTRAHTGMHARMHAYVHAGIHTYIHACEERERGEAGGMKRGDSPADPSSRRPDRHRRGRCSRIGRAWCQGVSAEARGG